MKKGGGSRKGGSYERYVCTLLSLWVSGGKRQDIFWRSAMSGGRANLKTRRKQAGEFSAQAGDIVATHPDGHLFLEKFCVDSKHYKDFQIDRSAFGRRGIFMKHWAKLVEESRRFKKMPMLIGRQNRRGEFVAVTEDGAHWLYSKTGRPPQTMMVIPYLFESDAHFLPLKMGLLQIDFGRLRPRVRID